MGSGNVLLQTSKLFSSFEIWIWGGGCWGTVSWLFEFRGTFWAWQGENIYPQQSPCRPLSLGDLALFLLLAFQVHFLFPLPTMSISCLKMHSEDEWVGKRSSEGEKKLPKIWTIMMSNGILYPAKLSLKWWPNKDFLDQTKQNKTKQNKKTQPDRIHQ